MKVITIPVTPFQQNCSLLICEETNKAAIVDPGGDINLILHEIKTNKVTVENIILTHGHLDHVGGAPDLAKQLDISIIGPEKEDLFWLAEMEKQCLQFGFPKTKSFSPDKWLKEGELVTVGNIKLKVLHIPGHTPGHIALYDKKSSQVIVGDILFQNSIGRCDFPRGDQFTLLSGIKRKLFTLPDNTKVFPGHGPTTTIGKEKASNPYLR